MIYVFSVIGALVVQGIIGYFMYREAVKQRMETTGIWLFATMFFGVFAIVAFVLARSSHKKKAAEFEQLYRTA